MLDQARWTAIKENDPAADGRFYYGVTTTGIFCLPSCRSKLPRQENIIFFDRYEQAVGSGFRPCKRCRPDLYSTYAPNELLLIQIKSFLACNSDNPQCLEDLAKRFNISRFHLIRIFKNRFGLTPWEYVRNKRFETAKNLLTTSDMKTVDIAFSCGFSSYTAFFTNFKKLAGLTPTEYRKGAI